MIYLGGSFAFGEGVIDKLSPPNLLHRFLKKPVRIYNYASPGDSINETLKMLNSPTPSIKHQVKESGGTAVYAFLSFHLGRILCARTLGQNWMHENTFWPMTNVVPADSPITCLESYSWWEKIIIGPLVNSVFSLNYSFHIAFSARHIRQIASVFHAVHLKLKDMFDLKDFVVIFYPTRSW